MFVEPGNTPLIKSKIISKLIGVPELYYKLEGFNPTGTHKDRIAQGICRYAKKKNMDTIGVATCGNFGAAIAYYAKAYNIKCEVYIPEGFHSKRLGDILGLGATIHFIPGKYEEVVMYCSEICAQKDWFSASPNSKVVHAISVYQYMTISQELIQQLQNIDFVSVPVSNGTTLAGVYYGFYNAFKKGTISKMPTLIAASTTHGNPIVTCLNKAMNTMIALDPETLKETQINEPLISYEPFDGQEALDILNTNKGYAFNISDNQMVFISRQLNDLEGLSVLPASTSALSAIQMLIKARPDLKEKRFVCVFTGRGGVQARMSTMSKALSAIFDGRSIDQLEKKLSKPETPTTPASQPTPVEAQPSQNISNVSSSIKTIPNTKNGEKYGGK